MGRTRADHHGLAVGHYGHLVLRLPLYVRDGRPHLLLRVSGHGEEGEMAEDVAEEEGAATKG